MVMMRMKTQLPDEARSRTFVLSPPSEPPLGILGKAAGTILHCVALFCYLVACPLYESSLPHAPEGCDSQVSPQLPKALMGGASLGQVWKSAELNG